MAPELASAAFALARRLAAAATLWCWAPGAPQHAQHLAVEFVHPVIMGTRALPAVAITEHDVVAALRPMARPGDVLAIVGEPEALVLDLVRRVEAWGLSTIWLGAGRRPTTVTADHLVWLGEDVAALHDGRAVLGYHILWELTHVCLEHPGLLVEGAGECAEVVCTTCSDEGRLGEVLEVLEGDDHHAAVRTASGMEDVSTMLVGAVHPGDLVLVHAGTAITIVGA